MILLMSSTYSFPINHVNNLQTNEPPQAIPSMHLQNDMLIKTSVFNENSMMCKHICSIQQTSGAPTSKVGPRDYPVSSSRPKKQPNNTSIKSNITFSFVVTDAQCTRSGRPGPLQGARPWCSSIFLILILWMVPLQTTEAEQLLLSPQKARAQTN